MKPFLYDSAFDPTTVTNTSQLDYSSVTYGQSIISGSITPSIPQQGYKRHLDKTELIIFLLTAVEWIGLFCDFARHPTPITTYMQVPTYMGNSLKFTMASQFLLIFNSRLDLEYSIIITHHVTSRDESVSFQGGIYSAQ